MAEIGFYIEQRPGYMRGNPAAWCHVMGITPTPENVERIRLYMIRHNTEVGDSIRKLHAPVEFSP